MTNSANISVIEENIEKSVSLVQQMQYTTDLDNSSVSVVRQHVDLKGIPGAESLWICIAGKTKGNRGDSLSSRQYTGAGSYGY